MTTLKDAKLGDKVLMYVDASRYPSSSPTNYLLEATVFGIGKDGTGEAGNILLGWTASEAHAAGASNRDGISTSSVFNYVSDQANYIWRTNAKDFWSIKEFLVKKLTTPVVAGRSVDTSDWRAWRHNAPGDCPCGIVKKDCAYHR